MPWAKLHHAGVTSAPHQSLGKLFIQASWKNKTLLSLNQAGLVEKFADAMVWIFLPVFFLSKGLSLVEGSAIIFVYAVTWGASQLITGALSDRIGRKLLIVGGMWICGLGLLSIPYTSSVFIWTLEAGAIGMGMAMLYPTLGATVADFAPAETRSTLLGIYRFWRDFGYAVAALTLGIVAQWTQALTSPFLLACIALVLSGLHVLIVVPNKKTVEN